MKRSARGASAFDEKLLLRILSTPSAPFRESLALAVLTDALDDAGVPWFLDPVGNLVVGAGSAREQKAKIAKKTKDPLFLAIAHLDHPGFHGARWKGKDRLEIQWHGGSPLKRIEGAKVWLATAAGAWGEGKFAKVRVAKDARGRRSLGVSEIRVTERFVPGPLPSAEALFGGFGFRAPVWKAGKLYYTKAADDLVGSFAAVSLAIELWKKKSPLRPRFLALLTRAEEVGFIGAIGHFELAWHEAARRPLLAVSLETSRQLPGAHIGKGPVVRLGDRAGVFHGPSLQVFSELAQEALPGRHQKRVMDGGTCEATAAQAFGLTAIGISIPLGNYHNQSFEGGPDSRGPDGPAPEFVHQDDIAGMLTLLRALLAAEPKRWSAPWARLRSGLRANYARYRKLL